MAPDNNHSLDDGILTSSEHSARQYRILGRTGLKVSRLGMGTGGFNCLGQDGDNRRPEAEMIDLLHRVYDLGINLFDTAPGYRESEVILGHALKAMPRDKVIVSTKVVLTGGAPDQPVVISSPAEIIESIENSLCRLQVTEIDVLLTAVSDPSYYDTVVNDQMPVLEKLKKQGKIRFIGSSEQSRSDGDHQWLQRALPSGLFDVTMVSHNMLNQSAQSTVFPICGDRNIGVINIFTVRNVFRDASRMTQVITDLKHRSILSAAVDEHNPFGWLLEDPDIESLVEAAYRYAAYTQPVSTAMCGSIHLHEIQENIESLEKGPLPIHIVERLRQTFGHIAESIGN